MKHIIRKRAGVAVVYALVILIMATMGGTMVLFLAMKNRVAVADYAGMQSASEAAMAGLKAFEGQCMNDPATVLAILKKYTANHSYKWLLGSAPAADCEQKIKLCDGTNAQKYSARIIGFDSINSSIIIEGIGYDGTGGKKKMIASYQLGGLTMVTWPVTNPYALYLGGALQNVNVPVNITGDVYLGLVGGSENQHFNKGGTIDGNLKTSLTDNYLILCSGGALTVKKNAFIRCKLEPMDVLTIEGNSGFENKGFNNFTSTVQLKGNAFFNHNFTTSLSNKFVGTSSKYCRYRCCAGLYNFTHEYSVSSAMSLADTLGMTPGDESPLSVNIPAWPTGVVREIPGISDFYNVDSVNNWWNLENDSNHLYKGGWLVLRLAGEGTGPRF